MIGLWQRGEVVQYSLTPVEGWNFRQLRSALQNQTKLEQTLDGLSDADIMAKLGAPELHPEGRFFPDTYRFTRGTSDWICCAVPSHASSRCSRKNGSNVRKGCHTRMPIRP